MIYQQNVVGPFLYLVQLDEDTIVDLQQTEQLQHLANLGVHLVHTGNKLKNDEVARNKWTTTLLKIEQRHY